MTRLWKWLKKETPMLNIVLIITVFNLFMAALVMGFGWNTPEYKPTQHANCTLAAKIHADDMKILVDKLDEQGQIIGAYRARYKGLNKLGD